jgi:hypothetical protein
MNVNRVCNLRQIEIRTAELLVPDPDPFKVGIAIEICNEIPAELFHAAGETSSSEIHKRTNSIYT